MIQKKEKIIIIGAGLAGMSAGIYGRLHGYKTEIYEMHSNCGGACTGWEKEGFVFDGCFNWLIGSIPSSFYYKLYEDLGIFPTTKTISHKISRVIQLDYWKKMVVYTNADRLGDEMLRISPEDENLIKEFIHDIKNPFSSEIIRKFGNITILQFAKRFESMALQKFIPLIIERNLPFQIILTVLNALHLGDATFPIGGAMEFIKKIEQKYKKIGGKIHYNSKVRKIITNNKIAIGIELESGEIIEGDEIISAADGYSTIFNMLESKYLNKQFKFLYKNHKVFPALIQISFGIDADLSDCPHSIITDEKQKVAGFIFQGTNYRHYCYDNTLSPKGKSVVSITIPTKYDQWTEIYTDTQLYNQKKVKILQYYQKKITQIYPASLNKIIVSDITTPMTFFHNTGNYKASIKGWYPNFQNVRLKIPKKLPGLGNFYMVGQWVEPGGGISSSIYSGKKVIDLINTPSYQKSRSLKYFFLKKVLKKPLIPTISLQQ